MNKRGLRCDTPQNYIPLVFHTLLIQVIDDCPSFVGRHVSVFGHKTVFEGSGSILFFGNSFGSQKFHDMHVEGYNLRHADYIFGLHEQHLIIM